MKIIERKMTIIMKKIKDYYDKVNDYQYENNDYGCYRNKDKKYDDHDDDKTKNFEFCDSHTEKHYHDDKTNHKRNRDRSKSHIDTPDIIKKYSQFHFESCLTWILPAQIQASFNICRQCRSIGRSYIHY